MKVKINTSKSIGKVIYVVEGDKTEGDIIVNVFNKFLNYNTIRYNKNNNTYIKLKSNNNKYSQVYIIPTKYSAINKLLVSTDYLDEIYHQLSVDTNLDVTNCAIYYLFDRDRDSNRTKEIQKLIDILDNSRDNTDYNLNGLLLLSYPSIEAFYCMLNGDSKELPSGKEAKVYIEKYKNVDVNEHNINTASISTISKIECLLKGDKFKEEFLDHFSFINKTIFNYEEAKYCKDNTYDTYTLLLISLFDLGILEIVE